MRLCERRVTESGGMKTNAGGRRVSTTLDGGGGGGDEVLAGGGRRGKDVQMPRVRSADARASQGVRAVPRHRQGARDAVQGGSQTRSPRRLTADVSSEVLHQRASGVSGGAAGGDRDITGGV